MILDRVYKNTEYSISDMHVESLITKGNFDGISRDKR